MEQFKAITVRNVRLYFRDKGSIFFSLLSMIIVIGLMVFFLGDMNIEGITELLEQFPGRDAAEDADNAKKIVLSWTCAGILSINAVTVTLAVYSVMIKDRVNGKLSSIYTAPVSRLAITAGYIAAAWVASVLMCILTLAISEIYGMAKGLEVFSLMTHVKLLGMIMVNSFTYASFMYLIALIAKTEGAWNGIGTVIGTLVGFLGGIYIPIGTLSDTVGNIMKCTPIIYGTAMFRSVMTKDIVDTTFAGVPEEITEEYRKVMGICLKVGKRQLGITEEWLILLVCGILFLGIGVWVLTHSKKTDR